MVTRGDPPRHIRDIAHLYISRMRRPPEARVCLAVAGMSADVIPAFHAANLALAAASRGATVRVEERSGLPVNTGYFLGLDPRCWVGGDGRVAQPVSAFPGVSFRLRGEADVSTSYDPRADAAHDIEVVHLPPWDSSAEHAEEVSRLGARATVLYVAERDDGPCPWRERGGEVIRRVAFVTGAARSSVGVDREEGCVGVFTRWKRALPDPVPVIIRDPGSRLSRQYRDAFSRLFAGAAPRTAGNVVDLHAAGSLGTR
jgi:hypothetical protein